MMTISNDFYVVISEMPGERAPQPRPMQSGFSRNVAYRVLGLHSASETSEAYMILANDSDELWFISNRHVRAYAISPGNTRLRYPSEASVQMQPLKVAHA